MVALEKTVGFRFPESMEIWDYDRNPDDLTPLTVRPYSSKKVYWINNSEKRSIKSVITNMKKVGNKPKYLSGKGLSKERREQLKTVVNLLSVHPEIAKEWDYKKNLKAPEEYLDRPGTKVWWKCSYCNHSWDATIANRTTKLSKCPACNARKYKLYYYHPELEKEYDVNKNKEDFKEVTRKSSEGYWWTCPDCGDSYKMSAKKRDEGRKCPKCHPKKVKYEKSLAFLYPDVADEWHPTLNGNITAEHVTAKCQKKVWWQCKKNPLHVWPASIHNRTSSFKPTGCPHCLELKRAMKKAAKEALEKAGVA
jgi:rubrerythrin